MLGRDGRFSPSALRAGVRSSHQPGPDSANIDGSLNSGPPGGKDALAEGIELDLARHCEPSAMQPQVEAANPGEEGEDAHTQLRSTPGHPYPR